ncbi:unnamed protein product [Ectocarpus sp. 12 AP-2014]
MMPGHPPGSCPSEGLMCPAVRCPCNRRVCPTQTVTPKQPFF